MMLHIVFVEQSYSHTDNGRCESRRISHSPFAIPASSSLSPLHAQPPLDTFVVPTVGFPSASPKTEAFDAFEPFDAFETFETKIIDTASRPLDVPLDANTVQCPVFATV